MGNFGKSTNFGARLLALCGVALISPQLSAQTLKTIYNFGGSSQQFSYGKLLLSSNTLYGIVSGASSYGAVFKVNTNGTGYGVIKNFSVPTADTNGVPTNYDGAVPLAGVVMSGGSLFGTTAQGGNSGKGTLFSVKTDGNGFTVLKHFTGIDGKAPYADLLLSGTTLYSTTAAGGASNKGTIFRINTDGGGFAVLKSLTISEGILPLRGLAFSDGTLYGAAYQGGISNNGTLFSVNVNGTGFTVLKSFVGSDGTQPHSPLVLAGDTLYGTTDGNGVESNSVVFSINTDGSEYAVLKRFSPTDPISGTNSDGSYVREGLVLAGRTLYGTTRWGGAFGNGVIFRMGTDGSGYTVLWNFSAVDTNGRNIDGALPLAGLMLAGGVLYGTTQYGGSATEGTVFSLGIAPRIHAGNAIFGAETNCFGFSVTGYSNQVVVIEACTDLAAANWVTLQTNILGFEPHYFCDPCWTNYTGRFYRVREP